jgi:hypothetical protein
MFMKTLVCIVAQVRNGELTWPGFKRHVMDALGADLALCIGDSRPRSLGKVIEGAPADETNGYFKEAKYTWRFDEPGDWSEAYDIMSNEWRVFASVPGGWLGPAKLPVPHGNSGGIVLFFRWFLLQKLIENNLLEQYDQFVVTRSDYYWIKDHPRLDLEHAWIPNGELHCGVCDRHIVVPSPLAREFLGIGGSIHADQYLPLINFYNELGQKGFRGDWVINSESYHWFRYLHAGLDKKLGFFPQKMYTVSISPDAKILVRYDNEKTEAEKDNEELITWPYTLDHRYMTQGMFTGRVLSIRN